MKKIEGNGIRRSRHQILLRCSFLPFLTFVAVCCSEKYNANYMLINLRSILLKNKQTNDKHKTLL